MGCSPLLIPFDSRFPTHTQVGRGKEGGNKDSQPQPTTEKRGKQQRQNRQGEHTTSKQRAKARKRGEGRGRQHTEPNLGRQKTTEAGQQREGTNALLKKGREGTGWVGGKWEKSERARKGQKKKVCALHPLDSPGGVEGAPTYTPVSKVAPKRGGRRGMRGQDHTLGPWEYYFALWLLLPCGNFAHRAASPYGLPAFPCWTWNVHLNIQNSLALEVQRGSGCRRRWHPSLILGRCPAITFIQVQT